MCIPVENFFHAVMLILMVPAWPKQERQWTFRSPRRGDDNIAAPLASLKVTHSFPLKWASCSKYKAPIRHLAVSELVLLSDHAPLPRGELQKKVRDSLNSPLFRFTGTKCSSHSSLRNSHLLLLHFNRWDSAWSIVARSRRAVISASLVGGHESHMNLILVSSPRSRRATS